jgi:hypothetical protein
MAGLTYNTFVTQLAELAVVPVVVGSNPVTTVDSDFNTIIPEAIEYAEQRICRDLDLLSTVVSTTATLTASASQLSLPYATTGGNFITIQNINVITPVSATVPDNGTRNPVLPVTKEFLQYTWPSSTGATVPDYFAIQGGNVSSLNSGGTGFIVNFGPWPDMAYTAEIIGTIRPATLSSTNNVTFISQFFPSMMLMAAMIYVSGYQRNFGKQSDDPAMAQSYESQYQTLLKGALMEEYRKKFAAYEWTSASPSPVATQ